ncbi:ras-domain-containing protein [Melanomma pulvis-pyrius CBS 109.77]|uniref:Ras-domain-containing protein n=1 Tax=Melanomma pulvis-pyrius CBS 109.77 TaxID=1314802 RepID=A0A6A6WQZ5_9PLEO|nr:ras-domain-containing protein [Melanomma pulvis-pyrius CBS 109.77]
MASKTLKEYKVVVAGAGGAGKSCFIIKFVTGVYTGAYDPTIEDAYRKVYTVDNEVVLFDILDTAGQEEYSAMREQYMRTCEGMIIMYDITNRISLDLIHVLQQQLLRVKDTDYFPMLIVGHKSDEHGDRKVSTQEGMVIASQIGCGFLEASAKNGVNVERAFFDIVREIRKYNQKKSPIRTRITGEHGSSSSCPRRSRRSCQGLATSRSSCRCSMRNVRHSLGCRLLKRAYQSRSDALREGC